MPVRLLQMPKGRAPPALLETTFDYTPGSRRGTVRRSSAATDDEDVIPIAIQLFFWRQSSPFFKQKFGKLTDASSIIFDRVLVQNILHGLSPSLTDAISSIPRPLLNKAAFPHVMYVCSCTMEHNLQTGQRQSASAIRSSLLVATSNARPRGSVQLQLPPGHSNAADNPILLPRASLSIGNQGLAAIDIRLFHTLHHLILSSTTQLLPLSTIQLFIYLFIPYIDTYLRNNEKEFTGNINLGQGMKLIWQPLFQHQQPNVPIFNSFVKPTLSPCQPQGPSSTNDTNDQCPRASIASTSTDPKLIVEKPVPSDAADRAPVLEKPPPLPPPPARSDRENSLVGPATIFDSIADLSSYKVMENNRHKQAPIVHMSSIYSVSDLTRSTISPQSPVDNSNTISDIPSPMSVSSILAAQPTIRPSPATPPAHSTLQLPLVKTKTSSCLLLATYFDVAVIRTLFSPSWLTDGYVWCLEYLHKRLVDISDKILADALCAGMLPINLLRFKSLSIPQINIIQEQTFDKFLQETYTNEQVTSDIIEQQSKLTITSSPVKAAPVLLNVPGDQVPSKGVFNQKYSTLHKKKRAKQLLARSQIHYIDEEGVEHLDLAYTNYYDHFGIPMPCSKRNRLRLTDPSLLLFRTSIVTIKEATVRPSTDAASSRRQTSTSAPTTTTNLNTMKVYSASDSEINYRFLSEIKEAHSSSGYINRSGTLNFSVVLAAIHAVVCKEHHIKVCEMAMNILDVLFSLNVISTMEDDLQKKQLFSRPSGNIDVIDEKDSEHIEEWLKQMDTKEDEKFQVAVDIILRILRRVGCSNCQSRGRSFNTDQLRGKVRVSLNKLRLLNQQRFEKCFLNFAANANLGHVFDVLHALCGYCVETTIGLAHYAPYLPSKNEAASQHSYANNFGNTHLSIGSKGIDGFILSTIFKSFVTRLNLVEKQIFTSDNTAMYNECRAFLIYMKENHGGIFRLAVFSALIDPERKVRAARRTIKDKIDRLSSSRVQDNDRIDEETSLPTVDEELSSTVIGSRGGQRRGISVTEVDDRRSYGYQEDGLVVDFTLTRLGLLRLNLIMDACPPGCLPDPQFLNSILFLDAPVLCKAAFLLQCAHYIRRCSVGQWPEWMKVHLTTNRLHEVLFGRLNSNPSARLARLYQAAAARMFYMWGEALAAQLDTILNNEQEESSTASCWSMDETSEDYSNEAIVNHSGHECPHSLKLIVCLVLYEITCFLRETYEAIPKMPFTAAAAAAAAAGTAVHSRQQRAHHAAAAGDAPSTASDKRSSECLRMHSFVSQTSNRSISSIVSNEHQLISPQLLSATVNSTIPLPNERHISFAVNPENDSMESAHTIIVVNDDDAGVVVDGNSASLSISVSKTGSISGSNGKSKVVRRTSTKLRRPSVRLKDSARSGPRASFRNRSRSHVSNMSSDAETHPANAAGTGAEHSDEYSIHPTDNFDSMIKSRPFPWLKTVIRILNQANVTCQHRVKCSTACYEKHTKSCTNLVKALTNMYQLRTAFPCSSSVHTQMKPSDPATVKKQTFSHYLFGEPVKELPSEKELRDHFQPTLAYLEKQVGSLTQIPLQILCKSAVLLEEEHYSQVLRLSWELLLDRNEELSACAATMVILTGARASHLVDALIRTEMDNASATTRYNAISRFQILWRFRYQFWIRLEHGAHTMMKILPPSIEFVLPSAALGIANLQTVDPPWMPHVKTLVEQVAMNQEEVRAVVTTSKTRKKHQQEILHSALMSEETSKRVARENFVLSSSHMLQAASYEPLLHQWREEDEEAYLDDDRGYETSVQLRKAQGVLPSVFSAAIFRLVDMLEDENVTEKGAAVADAARRALDACLLDDSLLFIRFFFEKLSHKERRIQSLQSLCRLMLYLSDIPPQFAHAIFNYVLGLLLSMARSPVDGSQDLFLSALTLFWQIIPYVHGLVLKDLKQTLRKEQAEMMILITGNIPSTKKVVIHGPDASQIPTQAIIAEETQFISVLQEALEFFGISDTKREQYQLIDIKTQQIHIPETYVRDFYFFRRNVYPQLSLVHMDLGQSQRQLEQAAIRIKTIELSKVLFARFLLENTPFNQIHSCIAFFHDEIIKSPLFPRKQLESDFNLYTKICNKELFNLDMLHKYNWIKFIACVFFNMDGKTSTTSDITLFLPIINGSFILHCEDLAMLRFCLATYISIVRHFGHIFASNGYLLIMPTFLRVYSMVQSNPMLKKAIEYCCRQFFILHRIPFILQMLGSVSQMFDFDEHTDVINSDNLPSTALCRLLIALEDTGMDAQRDDYSILELVRSEPARAESVAGSPPAQARMSTSTTLIQSLDFCYADDDSVFTMVNCFEVCVTIVAYAPDSIRALQMLGIIDILLPKYLQHLKARSNNYDVQKQARDELKIIDKLSTALKSLIHSAEALTRSFVEPKYDPVTGVPYKHARGSYCSTPVVPDEDSVSRFIDDRPKARTQDTDEVKQVAEFRWPRNTLLSIASTFLHFSTPRVKELSKLANDPSLRISELLDVKSYIRLADIAHTLLKLSSFEPATLACRGLQNYFQKFAPCTDWNQEQLRPALNLLLRRIDRMFAKVCKKPATKRGFDWDATVGILNGIHLTIDRYPAIAYFPNLKALVSGCIALLMNENVTDTNQSAARSDASTFPKEFPRMVIRLVGRYLLAIRNQPNIEILSAQHVTSATTNSTINHLLHFLLPMMLWSCSDRKDAPRLHLLDISYIVTILLNAIKPPSKLAVTMGTQGGPSASAASNVKQHLTVADALAPNSHVSHKSIKQLKELLHTTSLLGLKILIIGFSKQLKREWHRITQGIKSICGKQANISSNLLLFIDFLVSHKTPVYIILRPFLMHYMQSVTTDNNRDFAVIRAVQQKIVCEKIPMAKCVGEILQGLRQELSQLKADVSDESKVSNASDIRPISTGKVRFDADALAQMTSVSNIQRASSAHHFRQQRLSDFSLNGSPKKRAEKIRGREALDILETYLERYRIRCGIPDTPPRGIEEIAFRSTSPVTEEAETSLSTDVSQMRTPSIPHSPMSVAHSLTTVSDPSVSTMDLSNSNDDAASSQPLVNEQTTAPLRTFRGWKRYAVHFERSRSPRGSGHSQSTRSAHPITDPLLSINLTSPTRRIRQNSEQYSNPMLDVQASDFTDVGDEDTAQTSISDLAEPHQRSPQSRLASTTSTDHETNL